jgi:pimeloyl-ACP methyl ester carboxylesterase
VDGSFTEELVEAAGIQVQLRKGGQGDPLLVIPSELGVPGWLRYHQALAGHFTVYAPSLPGFGQSARPDWIINVRDLAAWVTWFVRDMNLAQPLNVIGFSMGGWAAAEIATMNASIFKKMVLVSPAGLKPEEGMTWDYFVNSGKEAFEQAFHSPEQSPEYAKYYGKDWTPDEGEEVEINREMAARLLWKPYMKSHTLAPLLGGVDTETLLIWGKEDGIIPVNTCQSFQKAIKGSKAHIMDHCGHMPEMEKPEEFVKVVLDFLK